MKNMTLRALRFLCGLAVAATLILASCQDDVEMPVNTHPSVVEEEDVTVTSFTLQSGHFRIPDDTEEVTIALTPVDVAATVVSSKDSGEKGDEDNPDDGESEESVDMETTRCFKAKVQYDGEELRFHMSVPAPQQIADGTYIMTMSHNEGKIIPGRLSVGFENGMLTTVKIIIPKYMLDGSGTEDDPYLIQTDADFEMFLINLGDDKDVYGAGLIFRQTADVAAPDQSSLISGRGYWGAPFAGIYDGGGHEIKGMFYNGAGREDSDSYFGLFTELRGSASVSHLSVTGVTVSGLYKWAGGIAGFTTGNIKLSDITVAGYFKDASAMGSLVGVLKSGTLTIEDVELQAMLEGKNDVGGLVGYTESGTTLNVTNITTPNQHFSVSGEKSVAGIVGRTKGTANISDVRLEHKVSAEDSDIIIIRAGSGQVGGIIGSVNNANGDQNLTRCYVVCPVGGKGCDYAGGIVGRIETSKTVKVNECRFYSVLTGNDYVGGLAGYVYFGSMGKGAVRIHGDDFSTRVAADDADAKITGVNYVGGFIGYFNGGSYSNYSKVKINLPVSGSGSGIGGVFGKIIEVNIDMSRFMLGQESSTPGGDTTMKVTGGNQVGGLAGIMDHARLSGGEKFDYVTNGADARVPDKGDFSPAYDCVVTGREQVGGLLGYGDYATISALSCAAAVTGDKYVGGVAGYITNCCYTNGITLEDVTFTGTLNCPKADYVGGIAGCYVGHYGATSKDCINYSDVAGGDCTGGIFGYVVMEGYGSSSVNVEWCVNKGNVTGTYHVGGIAGRSLVEFDPQVMWVEESVLNFSNCMNTGRIWASGGSGSAGVGGIVGFTNYVTGVMNCANHGDVYGEGQFHGIGGIAGSMGDDPKGTGVTHKYLNLILRESCNTGSVDAGNNGSFVGGILGYQEEGKMSTVEDCHNLGRIVPHQKHDCGGIVGCVDHLTDINRCVNQGKVEHGNAMIGTHKSGSLFDHTALYFLEGTGKNWPSATSVSAARFTDKSSFGGLDFESRWTMTSDGPTLRNNPWRDPSLAR